MAITRITDTDDDGSLTTGTIHNNAWLQTLLDVVDARWSRYTYSLTGNQNNIDVDEADLVLITSASASTITGLAAPASPAKPGKVTLFKNTGTATITFSHNSGSSSAGNKFFNLVTSAGTPIAGQGWIAYQYDDVNSRWHQIGHCQGAAITPTFAAGDFTAVTAGTWTVASGDVAECNYFLDGKKLYFNLVINTSSITQSGGNPTALSIANGQWGGFTLTNGFIAPAYHIDNGTGKMGYCIGAAGGTVLQVAIENAAQWATATDTTSVYLQLWCEVT